MADEFDEAFGLTLPPQKVNKEEQAKENLTDDQVKDMIGRYEKITHMKTNNICALVIGADGTAKTGTVLDYVSKLPKKVIVIDIDNGVRPVYDTYHSNSKNIIIVPGIEENEIKITDTDIEYDYQKSFSRYYAILKYVSRHYEDYSAVVIDGISTLLKNCEYVMRVEKHIAPDGGVNLRYWIQRNKRFTEILDAVKMISGIDKFFIGHEDFVLKEEAAAVKQKTNQMIYQRIICKKEIDPKEGTVTFKATIDKSKYNLEVEGKVVTFATVTKGKTKWDTSSIFEGLK